MIVPFSKDLRRDAVSATIAICTTPVFVLAFFAIAPDIETFSAAVPGVLVFSLLLVVFSTAVVSGRGTEDETFALLISLGASRVSLVSSVVAVQCAVATISLAFGLVLAYVLGFDGAPDLHLLLPVLVIGAFAHSSLGFVIGVLSGTIFRAFSTASVLMFVMMIFSGIIFPVPDSLTTALHLLPTWTSTQLFATAFGEPCSVEHLVALMGCGVAMFWLAVAWVRK